MSRRRGKGKPAYWCNNKVVRARETFHLQTCREAKRCTRSRNESCASAMQWPSRTTMARRLPKSRR